jgi:hypothetical protein
VVKTNEISLVDGDDTALAKIGRSLFLKIVSTHTAERQGVGQTVTETRDVVSEEKQRPDFQCCFCGLIFGSSESKVTLVIPLKDGGSQNLACHSACLHRVVHPSVPLAV